MGCPPRKILFFLQNTHHPKPKTHKPRSKAGAGLGLELEQDKVEDI